MVDGYRVTELAERAGVSVDTVRYYQHRGLLDAPERDGRVAWYSGAHLSQLERIRELKDQGLPLETIGRVLSGADPSDAALLAAVSGTSGRSLTLDDVAVGSGVPVGILETLVTEGLLAPSADGGRYSDADVRAVRAGMELLEAGVPLQDLLDLGRRYSRAVDEVADDAVELFNRYVRKPADTDTERVIEAFNRLLPAASALIRHNFERAVLASARRRLEEDAT
jgi:DNA-binding transcriptional MerR regulator